MPVTSSPRGQSAPVAAGSPSVRSPSVGSPSNGALPKGSPSGDSRPNRPRSGKPLSPRKLTANRANAARSTGPKTAAGKARCARNAIRHGLSAQTDLLPGEDPEELLRLRASFEIAYPDATPVESATLARIVSLQWKLQRMARSGETMFREDHARQIDRWSDRREAHSHESRPRRHLHNMADPIPFPRDGSAIVADSATASARYGPQPIERLLMWESRLGGQLIAATRQYTQMQQLRLKAGPPPEPKETLASAMERMRAEKHPEPPPMISDRELVDLAECQMEVDDNYDLAEIRRNAAEQAARAVGSRSRPAEVEVLFPPDGHPFDPRRKDPPAGPHEVAAVCGQGKHLGATAPAQNRPTGVVGAAAEASAASAAPAAPAPSAVAGTTVSSASGGTAGGVLQNKPTAGPGIGIGFLRNRPTTATRPVQNKPTAIAPSIPGLPPRRPRPV